MNLWTDGEGSPTTNSRISADLTTRTIQATATRSSDILDPTDRQLTGSPDGCDASTYSLQDIFRPVRNRLIELECEVFDQRCAAGTGGLYIARHIGARHNCLLVLVTDPTAWKASMQDAGYPKRAVRDLLNTIWTCDPRCEKMHAIARKHGKKFGDARVALCYSGGP